MTRLPTGMFQPGTSLLHRIDPRVKLVSFFVLLAAVVGARNPIGYLAALAVTALIVVLSKLPLKTALGDTVGMLPFFAVIFLMNACFYATDDAWFRFWIFCPSPAGVAQGARVVLNVLIVLILSNVLTCTTSPMDLTTTFESLFSPLRFLGVPTAQVAMILSVAVQFIPTLFEETEAIRKAQTARGATFESRKLSEKARAVLPLAVPIFLAAFRRADELSLAMEARGYDGSKKRKKQKGAPLHPLDWSALAAACALCFAQYRFL